MNFLHWVKLYRKALTFCTDFQQGMRIFVEIFGKIVLNTSYTDLLVVFVKVLRSDFD